MSLLIGASSGLQGAAGAAGGGGDLGDTIEQSLRFRGSQHLSRSFSSTSSSFTFSFWAKIATADADLGYLFSAGGNNPSLLKGQVTQSGILYNQDAGGATGTISTNPRRFRDPSAWYHIVYQSDAGTHRIYVNGQLSSTPNSGSSNYDGTFAIGVNTNLSSAPFEGYMAAWYGIDGTALDPTSFGKTNEDGVWVPQDYTGSYGTNGFKLVFDSSAGLGDDTSGNGNDFTATGFETTAISSSNFDNDIDYEDTPTSNHATFNPAATLPDNVSVSTITNANLKLTSTASGYINSYSTIAASAFDCYCEIEVVERAGTGLAGIGVGDIEAIIATGVGSYVTYRENGSIVKYPGNTTLGTESSYTTGDVLAMTVTSTQVAFYKNGTLEGTYSHSLTGDFFIIGMAYYNSGNVILDYNFGQRDFRYTVPTGFVGLETDNITEPTIKNGKDHFNILTWTGTGSSNALTGLGFQPDLVWVKKRANTTESHDLQDSIRGAGQRLRTDSADPSTSVSGTITSFDSDGFTVVDAGTTNESGKTYVAWCWKAGGTAVANTDGTINSNVSANTDAGFSIVSYTGTGSNATVGHGLNSPPEFVIVKNRDGGQNWVVGSDAINNWGTVLYLNNDQGLEPTNGSTYWNSLAPTSSVINIGSAANTNSSSNDMIAYCWHSVEGFSKFGSYDGQNSGSTGAPDSNGPFIYLGFSPSWLLIKRSNAGGDPWILLDSTRDTKNFAFQALQPNNNNQEVSSGDQFAIDFLSNGFKCRSTNAAINNSTATYVYMAFAENPSGGENAPPATAR